MVFDPNALVQHLVAVVTLTLALAAHLREERRDRESAARTQVHSVEQERRAA